MATEYKTGDTFPDLSGTIQDSLGNAVNVSAAISMRLLATRQGGAETFTGVAVKDDIGDVPTRGRWHYVLQPTNLSVAGTYEIEIEVTWSTGKIETFPDNKGRNPTFLVTPDLG